MKNALYSLFRRKHSIGLVIALAFAFSLLGCSGDTGPAGPAGPAGPPGPPGPPGPGAAEPTALNVQITGVTISSPPVVNFTVTDQAGNAFPGLTLANLRFTIAKLIPEDNAGNPSRWQSYINVLETTDDNGREAIQATTENNGTLVNNNDGTYSYTFATDIVNVTQPIAVPFQPNLTHRVGMELRGDIPRDDAVFTFRPADGATTGLTTRSIVQISSCNECHGKLALHGNGRFDTDYCVTCHNPGTTDPVTNNTVDFKVMIHKIHRSGNLPSVQQGVPYQIAGFGGNLIDFSDITYPQDIRYCAKCHDAADEATPDADNWRAKPSLEACGSCHDRTWFGDRDATPNGWENHPGGPQPNNRDCTVCHPAVGFGVGQSVDAAHTIPAAVAAKSFQFNIIRVQNTAPGQFPVITFSVTDPTNNDAPYDILNDPEFTAGGGVSRLAILIGWSTSDYTNTGSESGEPGQPISIDPLSPAAPATDNGDGTFTVTSPVAIPATVSGTGVVAIEGHPAADPDGDGVFDLRVPVKNVFRNFAITDASVVARRRVVDITKCNQCHFSLSLHGNNRTDEPQVCVICHNPNATDIPFRTAGPETPIDFKHMIHAIHAAAMRENPFVVIGFRGSVNDFSEVTYPGNLANCLTCHWEDTFELPLGNNLLATTLVTGSIPEEDLVDVDPTNDENITATASVCSSCHDSTTAKTHMEQNGAAFAVLQSDVDNGRVIESCAVCHGPGRIADVEVVHGIR